MENHSAREFFKDEEVLTLASSIARRQVAEQRWSNEVVSFVVPSGPPLPIEVQQSMQTGRTVMMLRALEEPDAVIDVGEISRVIIDDGTIVSMAKTRDLELDDEDLISARARIDSAFKSAIEHFTGDSDARKDFADELESARTIANRHSVNLHEVFDNDELFAESMRARFTPATYVDRTARFIERLNAEFLEKIIVGMADAVLEDEVRRGEITEEESLRDKEELMQELRDDPELEQTASAMRSVVPVLISKGIERFWGEAALAEVGTQLGRLASQHTLVAPTEGMLREQRVSDFIKTYCMEHDWDPTKLTIEQHRQINNTPEMRHLVDED